jgi:chromosome segregation ATPase
MSDLSYVHRSNPSPSDITAVSHATRQHAEIQNSLLAWEAEARKLMITGTEKSIQLDELHGKVRRLETDRSETQGHLNAKEDECRRLQSRIQTSEEKYKSQLSRIAEEAKRWKQAHDEMRASARELAFKAATVQEQLQDINGKHKNLQENHAAMKAKYQTLKENHKVAQAGQAPKSTEEELHASIATWKKRCQQTNAKCEALGKEALEKIREHTHALAEARSHHAKKSAEYDALHRSYAKAQAQIAQLEADLQVSCRDNARFHKELAAASQENARILAKIRALTHDNEELQARTNGTKELRSQLEKARENFAQETREMRSRLEKANASMSELAALKAEIPAVKSQLHRAAVLQEQLESLKKTMADNVTAHRADLALKQKSLEAAEDGLRTAKKVISGHAQRIQDTHDANERLKTETKTCAASIRNYHHVLKDAHTVLSVCTELQAKNSQPDNQLFAALAGATENIETFLRSQAPPQ